MSRDYEEKRGFPRMRLNCPATFTDPQTGESFSHMALNLSGGGVLFLSHQAYAQGTALDMQVEPGIGLTPPLRARIHVLRSEPREQGGFAVAATIAEVLPAQVPPGDD